MKLLEESPSTPAHCDNLPPSRQRRKVCDWTSATCGRFRPRDSCPSCGYRVDVSVQALHSFDPPCVSAEQSPCLVEPALRRTRKVSTPKSLLRVRFFLFSPPFVNSTSPLLSIKGSWVAQETLLDTLCGCLLPRRLRRDVCGAFAYRCGGLYLPPRLVRRL